MSLTDPVELLFFSLFLRWEKNAPLDGKQGLLDGEPHRNTQISRMAFVLNKIGVGLEDKYFLRLTTGSSWSKPGGKFLDKNHEYMENPYALNKGWWLEGCASLEKKVEMMQDIRKLGMSFTFIKCICDFISGNSILSYLPSDEKRDEIIKNIIEEESMSLNRFKAWCDITNKTEVYEMNLKS